MPGPLPKDPKLRQRRNVQSTKATLMVPGKVRKRALPKDRDWHPEAVRFWRDAWKSPMAEEWLEADIDALLICLYLRDELAKDLTNTKLASELRQQRACLGLTPMDRRRLQWETVRAETALETRKPKVSRREPTGDDPRRMLEIVS